MRHISFHDFSFLVLLAGSLLLINGIMYKVSPPNFMSWFGLQLKTARRNVEAWNEAIRFASIPNTLAGMFLIITGLLPFFFSTLQFVTSEIATTLISATCLVLRSLINIHMNRLFDNQGNRKDNG